jgi:hypothetical protein
MSDDSKDTAWLDEVVHRAEEKDPQLRQLRIAVDEATRQLALCPIDDKTLAQDDYRVAMRHLLHYLTTRHIN